MAIETPGVGTEQASQSAPLSRQGSLLILITAFLGWMFAGMEMSLTVPTTRPAIQDFSGSRGLTLRTDATAVGGEVTEDTQTQLETSADQWLSRFIAAFLLGAALGGAVFGWLGDRIGRAKAMGLSIVWYSVMTGLTYFVTSPQQFLGMRFLAGLGIGGMWPSGVALVMEARPATSRAFLAGWMGAAANVGFLVLGLVMLQYPITRDSWRWVLLLGGCPVFLGLFVLAVVPESPRWLAQEVRVRQAAPLRKRPVSQSPFRGAPKIILKLTRTSHDPIETPGVFAPEADPLREAFQPPLLRWTLLGIALGTIPLLGGWASGQRLIPWAGQVGEAQGLPQLKATVQTVWALGAVLGSLTGGWFARGLGNRASYFVISLCSLALSGYIFLTLTPTSPQFLPAAFALGLISTLFFGWLPYFLPTLFPTRIRATGTGVAFNFGRIFSAIALMSSTALSEAFQGNIAKMGAATSVIYAAGLVIVWFIPQQTELTDD